MTIEQIIAILYQILQIIKSAIEYENNELNKSVINAILPKLKELLDDAAEDAANEWYGQYGPYSGYKRHYSFRKAYDFTVDENGYDYEINDSVFGGHHQSAAFIKEHIFTQGYHGGSYGTDSSGDSAINMRYRTPTPWSAGEGEAPYNRWAGYAKQTTPIPELLPKHIDDKSKEANDIYNKEYLKQYDELWDKVESMVYALL